MKLKMKVLIEFKNTLNTTGAHWYIADIIREAEVLRKLAELYGVALPKEWIDDGSYIAHSFVKGPNWYIVDLIKEVKDKSIWFLLDDEYNKYTDLYNVLKFNTDRVDFDRYKKLENINVNKLEDVKKLVQSYCYPARFVVREVMDLDEDRYIVKKHNEEMLDNFVYCPAPLIWKYVPIIKKITFWGNEKRICSGCGRSLSNHILPGENNNGLEQNVYNNTQKVLNETRWNN